LESGAEFAFTSEPIDTDCILENEALIQYGNHKSAKKNNDVIVKSLANEVKLGFALILPVQIINSIIHSMVVPLGIAEQSTIDTFGNRIPNLHLTHDQTYEHLEVGKSSNNLTDKENSRHSPTASASRDSSTTSSQPGTSSLVNHIYQQIRFRQGIPAHALLWKSRLTLHRHTRTMGLP